jgi:drug/metabolite transporter (DMT)-like permease
VATVAGVMLAVTRSGGAPAPSAPAPSAPAPSAPAPGALTPGIPAPGPWASDTAAPAIGLAYGLIAALCYGVGGFMIGRYTLRLGWLVPVVVARGGAMVILLGLLATPLRGPAGARLAHGLIWAVAAGLADAAGLIFFTRGDQVGLIAVTGAASSAYPVIPLIGGLLVFRERLRPQQAGGAVLILGGLILLSFGS